VPSFLILDHAMAMQFIELIAKRYVFQFLHIEIKTKYDFQRIMTANRALSGAHGGCTGIKNPIASCQFLGVSAKTL